MHFKKLDNVSRFLYFGTIVPIFLSLLTPLIINSSFLFPFISPKTFFFRIIIEVAVFFYVLLALREPSFRPKLSTLTWLVVVFVGIATLASVFGVDPYRSFWGNIERGEGLLTFYHVAALFFVVTQTFKSKKIWEWLLHGLVFVTLAASLYGLRQFLGHESVLNTGGERLTATIGNAAFFAGYILFGIFLSAWFAFTHRLKAVRVTYVLIGLFELFILMRTETRGAFIGLVVGLVIAALITLFASQKTKTRNIALVGIVALLVSLSIVWWQKDSALVHNVGILRRLTTISMDDVTTQSRLLTWDSSWQGLKDRPLLGYGWENYNIAFNRYFHAEIYRDQGSQIWFDRAHNIVFDIAVTTGIIGLAAYVAIFVYSLRILFRAYQRTQDLPTSVLGVGLLVAYGIANMFVFDVLATYINFYIFLAFIVHLEQQGSVSRWQYEEYRGRARIRPHVFSGATALFAVGLLVLIYQFNVLPAQANQHGLTAYAYSVRQQPQQARTEFSAVFDHDSYQLPEVRQKFAEFAIRYAGSSNQQFSAGLLSQAISEVKKSAERHPLDVQHKLFLMILYNRSDQFDRQRLDRVFEVGERALELSPTRPQIYYELAQAHIAKGEFEAGLEMFEKALELQPDVIESRWNVAAANLYLNNVQTAQQIFDDLIADGFKYFDESNLRRMEAIFKETKNWESLVANYAYRIENDPENAELYLNQAIAYEQMGQRAQAQQALASALEIKPNLADQAQPLIDRLYPAPAVLESPNE